MQCCSFVVSGAEESLLCDICVSPIPTCIYIYRILIFVLVHILMCLIGNLISSNVLLLSFDFDESEWINTTDIFYIGNYTHVIIEIQEGSHGYSIGS
jgi:hypothetical protein